MQDKNIVK
jgi:hypothetical protein